MLGFFLVAKALTVVGPMLVVLVLVADRNDSEAEQNYWIQKCALWDHERQRDGDGAAASRRPGD